MIKQEQRGPRILTLDIETSPLIAYTWGPKWETSIIETINEMNILSYSAKWLNGNQITKGLCDYKGYKPKKVDDKKLVTDLVKLLDEADIVVTQNGVDYDTKIINARAIKHGITPPSPYKNIDTKREAKKIVRLDSYSLNDMGKYFNLGAKLSHSGFSLWKQCIAGNTSAWNKMKKYNAQDVKLTEQVYLKLKPYMKTHPNVNAYINPLKPQKLVNTGDCPSCESSNTHARGYATNQTTRYGRAQCQDCGKWYKYGANLLINTHKETSI